MSTPFDLHVLSTPPAFILSQDQTLNKMVSKELSLFKSSYWSLIHSFKEINQSPLHKLALAKDNLSFWCFVFLSRCLIYKVHATAFQLSVRYILAHSLSLVKHFFQKFFASYSVALSFKLVRPFKGTRSFYHTLSSLSRTFFKFFQGFQPWTAWSQPFLNSFRSLERTCLVYHTPFGLSSTFFRPAPVSVRLPPGLTFAFCLTFHARPSGARL